MRVRVKLPHASLSIGLRLPKVPQVAPMRTPRLQTEPRVTLPLDINNYPMAKFVRCYFKVRSGIGQGALASGHRPQSELTSFLSWEYGSGIESLSFMLRSTKIRRKKIGYGPPLGVCFHGAEYGSLASGMPGPECRKALGLR